MSSVYFLSGISILLSLLSLIGYTFGPSQAGRGKIISSERRQ